jgi:hypothetical protein
VALQPRLHEAQELKEPQSSHPAVLDLPGGRDSWQTLETRLIPFWGTRDVYLRFKGLEGVILNLDWVRFH